MSKEVLAIGTGVLVLLFAGFFVHAQIAANAQLHAVIQNGVSYVNAQESFDATDDAVLVGLIDSIAPQYQFKQAAMAREPMLDSKYQFWHHWILDQPIHLNELSEFETNLPFNVDYAKALTCEPLTNEMIQLLSSLSDNSIGDFGNYNSVHALLILHLYQRCPNAAPFSSDLANAIQSKKQEINAQPPAATLDIQLERYCALALAGQSLSPEQLTQIYSMQQPDGGWPSDYDTSRNGTTTHATALALCALIANQSNGGVI